MSESIEKEAEKVIDGFKERMRHACEDVLSKAYTDILPHVASDTEFNAAQKAKRAIESIIRGNVRHDGNYAVVTIDGIDIRFDLGADMSNTLCAALAKSMPECPKDRRIAALEKENQRLIDERFNRL